MTIPADRELDELVAAWPAWALTAEAVDEPELAHRLWATAPPYGIPPHEVDLGRARTLLLLGRFREALDGLARMADPTGAIPGDPERVLLAAAHAGCGDDDAYRFLLQAARTGTTATPADHLRLLAVVAEHRGAIMDAAWARTILVEFFGVATPTAIAAYAASTVAARDPNGDARAIEATVHTAATALQALHPPIADRPDAVLAATNQLEASGDRAGARLLLRAIDAAAPGVPPVRDAIQRLTPVSKMRGAALLAVLSFIVAFALVFWLATMLDLRHLRLGGLGALVFALWARTMPLPGFTRAESQAWRGLVTPVQVPGATDGPTVITRNTGLWGLGGVLGASVGIALAILLTADGGPLGTSPSGAPPVVPGGVTWLALIFGLGTCGVLASRALDLRRARRRAARREAAREADLVAAATHCVCGTQTALTGDFAAAYADTHLAPDRRASNPAIVRAGEGAARLARCRSTGALWLNGPLGRGGQWLALAGMPPWATPPNGPARSW